MTLEPILSWWIMVPLIAAALAFLGWMLLRNGSNAAERRDWLIRGSLVALLVIAALRPGMPGGSVRAAATDLNVFFVVDTTSSIVAEDYANAAPRLDGVRQDIMAIAGELAGARFALISFDSAATVRMPLTTDTSALETLVSVLGPQVTAYSTGSSVTLAGTVLQERLRSARDSHPERPRIVYYLGDGEQTSAKEPQPMKVDRSLVDGGAVLGYGTEQGGRMKENTGFGSGVGAGYIQDRSGDEAMDAVSVIDEGRLRDIAGQLDVPYVHRAGGDTVSPMLQKAKPGELQRAAPVASRAGETDTLQGRVELYWVFALAAFLLALRETFLVLRQLRQLRSGPGVRRSGPGGLRPGSGARR